MYMYSFRLPKFENQNAGGNGLSSSIPRLVRLIRQHSATIKSPMHISYPRINLLASVAVFIHCGTSRPLVCFHA